MNYEHKERIKYRVYKENNDWKDFITISQEPKLMLGQ